MESVRASWGLLVLGFLSFFITNSAASYPWTRYIHSPKTRNVSPVAIHSIKGNASVRNCSSGRQVIRLQAGSRVTLDFGVEVGGHIALNARSASSSPMTLAYTESPLFVGNISDDTGATSSMDWDQSYLINLDDGHADGPVWYHTPAERFRGGFRFLTLNALEDVVVFNVTCEIGFAPNMADLRSGPGYFYSDDELLNRIWYAGAYTIQTNIAPAFTGRHLPQVRPGWAYNATLSVASPALVDGAKRDRAVWPGDLGIQGKICMMAFGAAGRESVHNSLETLFHYQNATTGMLPFAGPSTGSFNNGAKSDTYHTWALIAMYDYVVWSGDEGWQEKHWANITRGVEYIVSRLDPETGLQEQVNENDWARRNTGGFNSALNALNYHALVSLASLSTKEEQAAEWREAAANIKKQYNALLWDEEAGMYRDNPESTLYPQDGNSLALLYGLASDASQRAAISEGLEGNWNEIGPVTPELADTISPFISGLELLAHLHGAENTDRAQRLLRRLWGYLLDDGIFTGSTFVEGLSSNGSLYYRSERSYKYDAAYTSLAHGWSSGPTNALITGVLGLEIEEIGGRRWKFKPQLGTELKSVQAGFETGLGWFEGKVKVGDSGDVDVDMVVPQNAKGRIVFPAETKGRIRVNGRQLRWQSVMDIEM